jgi:hypothetical protein
MRSERDRPASLPRTFSTHELEDADPFDCSFSSWFVGRHAPAASAGVNSAEPSPRQ